MLTIATINPKQAEEYYQQENYYSKGAALENSEWWGRGAETLGLSGAIADNEVYKNLVNGLSPDGKQALRGKPKGASQEQTQASSQSEQSKKQGKHKQSKKQKKQSEERAGVDMTFSAPKSVSLACLVGGDKRLEEAHRQAVKKTLEFIEKRYPQTRIKKQRVQTDNLTVAMWHHDTSRELDPHLHTHCILMNFTQLDNGKWQSRTDENLYYNKMLLGQIYRQELALECRKLGYEIEPQPKELFEIKGYTREQIEAFSKRHEQIVKYLEGREIDVTTESKVWAWRRTRVKKNHEMGRNEKLPYWHEEADLYGIVHPTPVQSPQTVTVPQVVPDIDVEEELTTAVSTAIEHCSERKVAFKSEEILEFVTAEVKPFGVNEMEKAIALHPKLIKTFDGRYTTQKALTRELATIELMQQGKGMVSPITHPETVEGYLENKTLTQGQREAVTVAATTRDQFIAWQGVAGAGKTYALNQLKQITTALSDVAPDYKIKGFAPSAAAAKVLEDELGIEANTVARLLVSKQSEQVQPNQIWIVDEAGLLSAKAAHELLERATEERARVILVGDTRQLSAIEAGNPFKSLQQAGIQTAHLDESLRQKAPDLQKAVNLAAAGQVFQALLHLEQVGRIAEIADTEERTKKIATQYIKLLPQERQNTLILAGTHKEQSSIVKEIRFALKQEGTLGYGVEATTLKALNLTSVQARYTHNYSVGDVVVPIREYRRSGLHKSQPYTVKAIAQDKLTLSDLAGNQLTVDPMKFRKTVYKQETNEIAVGDRITWTRNDKELGRRNGQEFKIVGIEGQTATIEYLDGLSDRIDLAQPLHCDYALVSTTYSSQGKTADRVLVSSTKDRTVSQESLYVAVSRAKHDLQIFAEDRSFLFEQAEESNAQETVLELLQPQPPTQAAQPAVASVNQAVKSSASVIERPNLRREAKSSTPNIAQPIQRSKRPEKVKPVEPPRPKQKIKRSKPIERPKPLEAFWIPTNAPEAPLHIEKKHCRELVEGSAIHPAIASLNFRSLQMGSIEQEHEAWEYLMYSDKLERTNTGRLAGGMLNRYAHIEAGGWWCSAGVDARSFTDLEPGQKPKEQIWGCYKPDAPRENIDKPGKKIKYEHPPKTDLGIFLLDVPDDITERIYQKAGVDPQQGERANGFWYCVWKHNLPVTITEGAKKAACLLSQGHAAIGLPGIYAGYRSKDEQGNEIKAHLHEELAVFATPGREIRFCFDFETREETKRNIEIAISRTGSLLKQQSAKVKVVSLPGPEKGVDDFIVAKSPLAYERQNLAALELQQWRSSSKQQRRTVEPPKKLSIEQRKEQLKNKLDLQQPTSEQNPVKSEEKTYDRSSQQLETEWAADRQQSNSENNSATEREDRTLRNEQPETERENRTSRVQSRATERENSSSRNQPDRKPERIENQLHRLLEAINGYLELQEVEQQLGDDIERISRSRAGQYLRGEGTEGIARKVERQNPASLDGAASDGSIELQGGEPEQRSATRQLLSALSDYVEVAALESSPVAKELQTLAENLSRSQHQGFDEAKQPETSIQALAAIAEFVEESYIESALTGTVESVVNQLSSDHQRSISSKEAKNGNLEHLSTDQITSDQAIDAISSYVEQQEVLGSKITQDLEMLAKQLGSQKVAANNQQINPARTEHLAPTDYEQITQRAMEAIALYVEAQTIEAFPLKQNLEALIDQLPQRASQEFAHRLQQAARNVAYQTTVVKTKALELQISQLVEAITDYVEVAATEAALAQPLENLLQGLNQRQASSINKGQKNEPCLHVIADYIEQEAVEVEMLPALENLVAELNTLRSSESIAPVAASPNSDISKLVLNSITNYVEQAAIESEITEGLEGLAKELAPPQPKVSNLTKQLDTIITNLLQQLKAASARKQQEISASSIEAIVNYVEQSEVESALNPQVLQTLSNQFEQVGESKLTSTIQQLGAIVANYQTRLQAQILTPAVEAITHYCEQEALSKALTQDINLLVQNLSLTNLSQTPNQLQQLSEVIDQYHKQMEAQQTMNSPTINSVVPRPLKKVSSNRSRFKNDPNKQQVFASLANSTRDRPLEDVAERLGLVRDRHDQHKWRGEGQIISINDQKFYDHSLQKGGYGAIDLVIHVQGQSFKEAVNWLSNGTSYAPPTPTERSRRGKPSLMASPQPKVPEERQPFQPPVPDKDKWQEVRQYLVFERGLPEQLVDQLHSSGKIYAAGLDQAVLEKLRTQGYSHPENITNAVFLRQDLEQKPTGASLRGVSEGSSFKGLATGSHRDNGWFSFTQGAGQLERIVLVESAIDALSAAALAKQLGKTMFISTDGAGSVPVGWLQQKQAQGIEIIAAHDADRAGEEMAQKVIEMLPTAIRAKPSYGKDWNEQLIQLNRQNEALETAQAVRQMFNYIIKDARIKELNSSCVFEASKWRFVQQNELVTITVKEDNREILRVDGDKLLIFHPTPTERVKMTNFRHDIAQALRERQKQQQQQSKIPKL